MAAPFYLNDTATLSFQVTNAFGDATVTSATVDVFDPADTKRTADASATLANGNELTYTVDQDDASVNTTNIAGTYTLYFEVLFNDNTRRTHKVTFVVVTRDL